MYFEINLNRIFSATQLTTLGAAVSSQYRPCCSKGNKYDDYSNVMDICTDYKLVNWHYLILIIKSLIA